MFGFYRVTGSGLGVAARPRHAVNNYDAIDRLRVGLLNELGGVPREQKMLKGHLPRDIYHQVY